MGVDELTTQSWEGYAARWASLHGVDPRQAAQPFRGWLRLSYGLALFPARIGASPGGFVVVGFVASMFVPMLAWRGGSWPLLAAAGVLTTVVANAVGRAVAVITESVTRLGYVYSAVAERIAEACWLFALWLLGAPAGLLVVCGAVSWLHEYVRSRTAETGTVVGAGHVVGEPGARAGVACAGLVVCGLSGAVSDTLARGAAAFSAAVWLLLAVLGFAQLLSVVRRALT